MKAKLRKSVVTAFAGSIPDMGAASHTKKRVAIEEQTVPKQKAVHKSIAAPKILFRYKSKDSIVGVQKATVKQMEEVLGLNETQVIHYALAKLAKEVIPAYEPDDAQLTTIQIELIKKLSGISQDMPMTSSLFV